MRALDWLGQHDRDYAALRRAARAAIVMPSLFAIGVKVIDNANIATFAAFGSFAMLLLVDFGGPMRERLQAQGALAVAGFVLISLATLASQTAWSAAIAMTVVAFAVLFAGVISSVLAGATPALLLAFILPAATKAPPSSIPDRLAGWALASVVGLIAIAVLWPVPTRNPLREQAARACRALATRLRADVTYRLGGGGSGSASAEASVSAAHVEAIVEADAEVSRLHTMFLATPYRPTGLGTSDRTVIRLVDELNWLNTVVIKFGPHHPGMPVNHPALAVKLAAAAVLEQCADVLPGYGRPTAALETAVLELQEALLAIEKAATLVLPVHRAVPDATDGVAAAEIVSSLEPGFRSQELNFAVRQVAANVALTAAADRRSWLDRILGRQPVGISSTLAAAQERARAHLERHSVWLHNSIRGAVGLGAAILVANLTGVQHSFWVVLGTLSVLRSNALNTGQNVLRGLLGTTIGFIAGALLLVPIGDHTTVLWALLPIAILVAGIAPAAISFAAGQLAFTLTLVILFNIIAPAGWHVGLVRVEDVAIGCAVSLVVGLVFWPRGAAAALGTALAEAYEDSAGFLAAAVAFGAGRCTVCPPEIVPPPAPQQAALRAAAASRRLDDAFRTYLAERGSKPVPLAEMTELVTGVVGLRLAGDAVVDLWLPDDAVDPRDRGAAREEMIASAERMRGWYERLAGAVTGRGAVPAPLDRDEVADGRLIDAVRRDLRDDDGRATATAVRVIWTGDHLDAARRLQYGLVAPARVAAERGALAGAVGAKMKSLAHL